MQILASSIRHAAETFLHAGYISATPSGAVLDYPMLLDTEATGYAVSLTDAFASPVDPDPVVVHVYDPSLG